MCKGVKRVGVMVNMQDEGRSLKLDNRDQQRTKGGVGQWTAVVGCSEGEGGWAVDLRRAGSQASGECRKEAVVGELGLSSEGAKDARGGKGGGGGRWALWCGVIDGDPNVPMEVSDGSRDGRGG